MGITFGTALAQAPAVATGDSRTVTEPSFPSVCQQLTASFHDVNEDVPASVEGVSTQLDLTRLQNALTTCTGTNQAVELSIDGSGNNAFLTGPISIPAGVTLLVDSGVTLYFSRNAQDYDTTPGTHTCGTVSGASNTGSCKNLITIKNANNSGIMGYGKMNGRGGDVVLNSFVSSGYGLSKSDDTWWDIANDATTFSGSQQNPRWIQMTNSNNVTLYKITLKNAPNFHIAISGGNGVTIWGIKIITPYSAHNTDGIDPSNGTNFTIRNVSGSDGDDNIAVGATTTSSPVSNFSIIHNRFFAGHGESIGSITEGGATNILFDSNMMYGDADVDGSNSTAIRIKSADDRGGVIQNVQYSNSCFSNHGTQIQFNTLYNTTAGTLTPNFKDILLQNLRFLNTGPVATGSVTFQGATNGTTVNPLVVQLDNVMFDTLTSPTNFASPNTLSDIYQAQITLGPGAVSSNLATPLIAASGSNGNVITGTGAGTAAPPVCVFTFLTPEITGPTAQTQTVTAGQFPTAVVILSPAMATAGSAVHPYPTGTVTVTDELSHTFTATLPGTGDTIFIPITNAPVGTHTYSASYGGDSVYAPITAANFGSTYTATVNTGTLSGTSLALIGVPPSTTFGTSFTATATLTSTSSPSGSISFLVNGSIYSTVPIAGNAASYSFSLPIGSYAISAVYNGDSGNGASISTSLPTTVGGATTTTVLASSSTSSTVGVPITLTATVTSQAGTPTGTVAFSYTNSTVTTPTTVVSAALVNGVAASSAFLPQGTDNLVATYTAFGNFGGSVSTNAIAVVVSPTPPVPAATLPLAMPYTLSSIAGGGPTATLTAGANCPGTSGLKTVDTAGDGCPATAIALQTGSTAGDLRSVTIDPFGNIYFTDGSAALVRRISTNGVVSNFAGRASNAPTACTPTVSPLKGCNPLAVSLSSKPRGVYSDPFGNIYIAGYGNNLVHVVKVVDGLMYIAAGNGTAATQAVNGDGGLATSAELNQPRAVTTDAAGNIYIADTGEDRVREVLNPNSGAPGAGSITTVVGSGNTTAPIALTPDDVNAVSATNLTIPQGVAVDASANIFVSTDTRVRAVCATCSPGSALYSLLSILGYTHIVNGNIYTVAGTITSGSNPTLTPGLGNTVNLSPQKIVVDPDGNLYIADSANNAVWFEDGRTGYAHVIAGGGSATTCTGSTVGDGCKATLGVLGSNGGNGIGVGLDLQGNLYVADSTNLRIRKVSNDLRFGLSTVGTAVPQTIQIHYQPGDTPTAINLTSPDFALGASTCTLGSDTTTDCTYPATFKPAVAGLRIAPLAITTTLGNPGSLALTGSGTGAGATLDPAAQITFGQNLSPSAMAVDNAGSVYVADASSKNVLKYAPGATGTGAGSSAVGATLGSFTSPVAVAVDAYGNTFVADSSTGLITAISSSGISKTLSTAFAAPTGLAVDSLNNLYVSDSAAKTITEIGSNLVASRVLASAGLTSPAGIAVDGNNNLFVADQGASAIFRIDAQTFARTTASTAAASPHAVSVDAAGNLLIADTATGQILAVPSNAGSASFSVASGIPGNSIALDSAGDVYTASATGQVLELERTQGAAAYNGTGAAATPFALLSTGNVAASLAVTDPDTTNFALSVATGAGCTGSLSGLSVGIGNTCTFTSSFSPSARLNYTNSATFSGNASNASLGTPPTLEIVQIGNNAPFPVSLTFGGFTPSPAFVGNAVTLNAAISSTFGNPSGAVVFSIDGNPLASVPVVNGAATTTVSPLTAGNHAIAAAFASSDPNFASATATATTLAVAKNPVTALLSLPANTWPYAAPAFATVNVSSTTGTPSGTVQFTVDGTASGQPVTLTAGVATYSIPVIPAGQHTIAATYSGDATFVAAPVAGITATVSQIASIVTWTAPASIVYGTTLATTQLNATASVPGTFVYTPALGATLNASALPQTLSVTFTPTDTVDYTKVTKTTSITVTQAVSTLTWSAPASIVYGTTLTATQLNAIASVPGTFVYTPALGATLSASALPQTLSVTFTPTDTVDYTKVTKTTSITVTQAVSTVTWTAPASIVYGTTLTTTQLNATASVPGTFVYTPALGATLNASAQAQTLSVIFTPTDTVDYATATKTATITVTQATPTLTWAAPASIPYATALSATQLNATASVAGTFVYAPAAGAVLGAGTQALSAAFTPTDAIDYTAATKTNSLVVAKQASNTALTLSTTSLNPGQSVTLSAVVTGATSGTPTGTITFLDGTTTLATSNLTAGVATFTTAALLSGSHSITANYSGDTNYTASSASSSATTITVAPLDFTVAGSATSSNLTVHAGTPAVFVFQVSPTFGNYPSAVTFTASGLPSAAIATFSPTSIAVNGGTVNVTLTIQTAGLSARNSIEQRLSPIAFALLLLPLSLARKFSKSRMTSLYHHLLLVLVILLGAAAATGLSACGTTNNQIKDYDLSITTTSGTVQHTTLAILAID